MQKPSLTFLDIRDAGESIASTSKDIGLLMQVHDSYEDEIKIKAKHANALVDNIVSILTYLTSLEDKLGEKHEEIDEEIRKIEFCCFGLRFVLSQTLNNVETIRTYEKEFQHFLRTLNMAANRIITITLLTPTKFRQEEHKSNGLLEEEICYSDKQICDSQCEGGICYENRELSSIRDDNGESTACEEDNVCYKDKSTCEESCDGICYEEIKDKGRGEIPCPEYTETFTESPHTRVENGEDKVGKQFWDRIFKLINYNSSKGEDIIKYQEDTPPNYVIYENNNFTSTNLDQKDENVEQSSNVASNNKENGYEKGEKLNLGVSTEDSQSDETRKATISYLYRYSISQTGPVESESTQDYIFYGSEKSSTSDYETTSEQSEATDMYSFDPLSTLDSIIPSTEATSKTSETENRNSYDPYTVVESTTTTYETTIEPESTTEYTYDAYSTVEPTTSSYDSTSEQPESKTLYSADESDTVETTTCTYETTTQDLYKVSQDISSAAQDLSTKANEISSITSDISSKVSNVNSMVSDLNTYDDDELSKKVQSVSKITQEISSKTSEISSLCSTTSSLASDISSASSDMPSADRNHPFRTSPWQKMSSKCQDMVTSTQAIVTAAQDILLRMDSLVATTADLKVAESVATASYEVTTKTQLVISETLNIMSAVIELMNVIET